MSVHSVRYPIDEWQVREIGLDIDGLAQPESLFALSNGHIGVRANLDEGDPSAMPGTYLNSFYETRPLPYAEAGYGFPETGQSIVNVTNGKLIRLLVDDEPFDLRYGTLHRHERTLDLRAGTLHRRVEWESPSGQRVLVASTRLVSLTQRSILGVCYTVTPLSGPARIVLQSELVANEELPRLSGDPRVAAVLGSPLSSIEHGGSDMRAWLIHETRQSGLRVAVGMTNSFSGDVQPHSELSVSPDMARLTAGVRLEADQSITLQKVVAYGWSARRTVPALRDQVAAALLAASASGWDALVEEQRAALDVFWSGADVEIDGDPAIQQAVRFALFHTYQAAARAEQRAIPAKGLTGTGYDGHAFWDTEAFVLPVLTAVAPHAALDALRWRTSVLDLARDRAGALTFRGAAFPWRTIRGQECSGYWPAGSAALHINADIAVAGMRYVAWTAEAEVERDVVLPVLVETARLWASVGYHGIDGHFHIDGVTGPDEYSALADDNVYTNLMARLNLAGAADAAERWHEQARELGVSADEVLAWRAAADTMAMPYDEERGVYQQDRGFTGHDVWDFAASAESDGYPLLLHAPYLDLYRKQVIKQADLILAMHWCGDRFTAEDKARAFAYYEPLTVRDSSLSACTQAVMAAEVGHLDLALEYAAEAAFMDLHDHEHNTRDGLHIASLAGAWLAVVAGFGGMRDHGGRLSLRPQLPEDWTCLSFRLRWHGRVLHVRAARDGVDYTWDAEAEQPLELIDAGTPIRVRPGETVRRPMQFVTPMTPRPTQPPGREPRTEAALEAATTTQT